MKIQIEPVQGEVVLIELDEAMVLLKQLQIDLQNYGVLTKKGWNVFNLMSQEIEKIRADVITKIQ